MARKSRTRAGRTIRDSSRFPGPYNQGGRNQVRSGGKQVEIHLGRFSADFSKVEAWARVTNNSGGDSHPDVWIDPASERVSAQAGWSDRACACVGGERPAAAGAGAGTSGAERAR